MRPMRTPLIALLAAVLMVSSDAQVASPRNGKKEVLHGRVVADVVSLVFGAGVGPKWTKFIFSVEQPDGPNTVLVAYAFNQRSQLPPDSFWNYANRYELKVKRDQTCDTTVREVSYEKNVDAKGNELPPTFILRMTKNNPVQALDPALKLPCYVLWYSDYKQVKPESAG